MQSKTLGGILASAHWMPMALLPRPPAVTVKCVCRCWSMRVAGDRPSHHTKGISTAFELGNSELTRGSVILLLYTAFTHVLFSLSPQRQNSRSHIKDHSFP